MSYVLRKNQGIERVLKWFDRAQKEHTRIHTNQIFEQITLLVRDLLIVLISSQGNSVVNLDTYNYSPSLQNEEHFWLKLQSDMSSF